MLVYLWSSKRWCRWYSSTVVVDFEMLRRDNDAGLPILAVNSLNQIVNSLLFHHRWVTLLFCFVSFCFDFLGNMRIIERTKLLKEMHVLLQSFLPSFSIPPFRKRHPFRAVTSNTQLLFLMSVPCFSKIPSAKRKAPPCQDYLSFDFTGRVINFRKYSILCIDNMSFERLSSVRQKNTIIWYQSWSCIRRVLHIASHSFH